MNSLYPIEEIVSSLSRSLAKLEAEALHDSELAELSMKQIIYLETIAQLQTPTFSELAQVLCVSKPSVTAITSKLIQKGYIKKQQSPEDHRAYHIVLTEKGQALSKVHRDLHLRLVEQFTAALSEEDLHTLVCLLSKVIYKKEE